MKKNEKERKKDTNGMNEMTVWNTEFLIFSQTHIPEESRHIKLF